MQPSKRDFQIFPHVQGLLESMSVMPGDLVACKKKTKRIRVAVGTKQIVGWLNTGEGYIGAEEARHNNNKGPKKTRGCTEERQVNTGGLTKMEGKVSRKFYGAHPHQM